MALIVDTHALVWIGAGNKNLSAVARAALTSPEERILVSAITAFEYVDLQQRDRIPEAASIEQLRAKLHFEVIELPATVWEVCARLPDIHRDPIDRMLIAHAIIGDFILITADVDMRRYPVRSLW